MKMYNDGLKSDLSFYDNQVVLNVWTVSGKEYHYPLVPGVYLIKRITGKDDFVVIGKKSVRWPEDPVVGEWLYKLPKVVCMSERMTVLLTEAINGYMSEQEE